MTLAKFDRSAAVADQVIAAIKSDQLDDPTPCTEWTVRQLLNHLVSGNLVFVAMVEGGPRPDRSQDHLGGDPLGAFRDTLRRLRAGFARDGVLEETFPTPFGPGPGSLLVHMRVNEMLIHSWDLAKATGQSTDLDPELAEECLASFRSGRPIPRGGESPFGPEQPAPETATAADRLAAHMGRVVA
jgi:uncharacterized protein (TIGR03086 family)